MTVLEPRVKMLSALKESQDAELDALADAIAQSVQAR